MYSAHNHYTKRIQKAVDWHRHDGAALLDWPEVDAEPTEHSTTLFTREALHVIQSAGDDPQPFFLHLSYTAVHDPLMAPEHTYTYGVVVC